MDLINCQKCSCSFASDELIQLKCDHSFCWKCMEAYVTRDLKPKLKCPLNCDVYIPDKDMRRIIPSSRINEYENICLQTIRATNSNLFNCLLSECDNMIYHDTNFQFECSICGLFNCIECKGTHPFMRCSDYQTQKESSDAKIAKKVKKMEEMQFKNARDKLRTVKCNKWKEDMKILDKIDLVPNCEIFECCICMKLIQKDEGVTLRKCFHNICKICLQGSVHNAENIPITCPVTDCKSKLEEREIRGILDEDGFNYYQRKCTEVVKGKIENIFHCKTHDCNYFVILENKNIAFFTCSSCNQINCLKCMKIHGKDGRCVLGTEREIDKLTKDMIEAEIKSGKSMKCPGCSMLIRKDGGCNFLRCPKCKMEICWILKIPRWGPKGSGDISGGCRCGVNNKPCHKDCLHGCIPE